MIETLLTSALLSQGKLLGLDPGEALDALSGALEGEVPLDGFAALLQAELPLLPPSLPLPGQAPVAKGGAKQGGALPPSGKALPPMVISEDAKGLVPARQGMVPEAEPAAPPPGPVERPAVALRQAELPFVAHASQIVTAPTITMEGVEAVSSLRQIPPALADLEGLATMPPTVQASSMSATTTAPRTFAVELPLTQQGWGDAVGERVLWMVGRQVTSAEIRLNPPHLGPLEVKLSMEGDSATLQLNAPQAAVRDALESSMPRLRLLLAEGGIDLAGVSVGDGRSHAGGNSGDGDPGRPDASPQGTDRRPASAESVSDPHPRVSRALVDFYA